MPLKSPSPDRMLINMVPLDAPAMPPRQELLETLSAIWGLDVDSGTVESNQTTLAFRLDEDHAGIALIPSPLPWSNLEGPCATAWWWPEAEDCLRNHGSHLLIVLAGTSGDVVRRALALTRITAAAAAHADSVGVFWGGGSLVHNPRVFFDEARQASMDDLPLHLWIDFRIERNDDGTHRLFTTGMKALGSMEIEIPDSRREPVEIQAFAYSIADYILARGARIRDGHTVGRSDDEKVLATHAPSMWDAGMTVLRLEF